MAKFKGKSGPFGGGRRWPQRLGVLSVIGIEIGGLAGADSSRNGWSSREEDLLQGEVLRRGEGQGQGLISRRSRGALVACSNKGRRTSVAHFFFLFFLFVLAFGVSVALLVFLVFSCRVSVALLFFLSLKDFAALFFVLSFKAFVASLFVVHFYFFRVSIALFFVLCLRSSAVPFFFLFRKSSAIFRTFTTTTSTTFFD